MSSSGLLFLNPITRIANPCCNHLAVIVLAHGACVVGIGTRAEAQNYPWCAIYGGFDDGDAAVVQYSGERLTLRKGATVLREHGKVEPSSSVTR
jgi:hypothetical protein